jgi:PAS domain S-box-containing protein
MLVRQPHQLPLPTQPFNVERALALPATLYRAQRIALTKTGPLRTGFVVLEARGLFAAIVWRITAQCLKWLETRRLLRPGEILPGSIRTNCLISLCAAAPQNPRTSNAVELILQLCVIASGRQSYIMSQPPDLDLVLGPLGHARDDDISQYLASIVESSDDAILSKDLNGIITSWNRGAERLFGYTAEEAVGKPITILIPPDRQNEEVAILERIRRGQRVDHYETIRQRKHGSLIAISLTLSPIRNAQGKIIGASKIARDITQRKQAHERQQFLIRELQHRTQNLFAVIQSVANRTLVEEHTIAEAKEMLNGRLAALAHAYGMLADAAWEGVPLKEIIRRAFAPFSQQLDMRGCNIIVNTPAAQQFALMIHELATNAVKYGALSVPNGRVSIECDIERTNGDGTFSFQWKETGGPPILLPPKRQGFGSVILLDGARQFGQHVALNYDPEGLRYDLRFPLSAIEAARKQEKQGTSFG